VPGLEAGSLIPSGDLAGSFEFDIRGAYYQSPHAPPSVSLILFTAGEGVISVLHLIQHFSSPPLCSFACIGGLVVGSDINFFEGVMTIPGTGQKWRGRGGDLLIAADTDRSREMDWKAGTRVVDFFISRLDPIPKHKVVPPRKV